MFKKKINLKIGINKIKSNQRFIYLNANKININKENKNNFSNNINSVKKKNNLGKSLKDIILSNNSNSIKNKKKKKNKKLGLSLKEINYPNNLGSSIEKRVFNLKNNFFKIKQKYIYNISFESIPGIIDGKLKENQDKFFIEKNILNNKNYLLLGIIDGHGLNGRKVADYVKINFFKIFKKLIKIDHEKDDIIKIIKFTFLELNKNLINKKNINTLLSGCTLSVWFIFKSKIYSANLGDSQIYMIRKENDKLKPIALTKIHCPENQKEKNRILKFNGEIRGVNNKNGIEKSPKRIWVKNENYPGLMITRSIGDVLGRRIGVIASPNISITELNSKIKYIILGTDGLWDYLLLKNLEEIKNTKNWSKKLSKISKDKWKKNIYYNDDITCLTLKIDKKI